MHDELSRSFSFSTLSHWAPNCSTFSRARERPIPGVKNPPRPLRSEEEPMGIPKEMHSLPPAKRRKVLDDTKMAVMSAEKCIEAHDGGKKFSLEHPGNSLARYLPSWAELESREGFFSTEYHTCMFEPCERKKFQRLIHNHLPLDQHIGRRCEGKNICSRTGKPHKDWRPKVSQGKVISFATGDEREYPRGFCEAYAEGVRDLSRSPEFSFLEVFSGPNAPLSSAVAATVGESLVTKSTSLVEDRALRTEESRATKPTSQMTRDEPPSMTATPRESKYRRDAISSGKQPSYGKRIQMIEDGLNDPIKHLEVAKTLQHPFSSLEPLKEDHRRAAEFLSSKQDAVNAFRLSALSSLKKKSASLRDAQIQANKEAAWTARKLGLKIQTELMKQLQTRLEIEDEHVPQACLHGLGITGEASVSKFFDPFEVPPSVSSAMFFQDMESRSARMVERVRFMGEKGGEPLAVAIHQKTQKEVAAGTMGPPLSLKQVEQIYGTNFQVVPSFGLTQGVDSSGEPKFRRIDDHSACLNNQVAKRMQKVPMAMVDYVAVMIRALTSEKHWSSVMLATEDMKGAYRQVPLAPQDVRYAITGVFNPWSKSVDLHEMYGQPFGAGHAVPNFCRVAEWISRCLQRLYHMMVDHFFDDFFVVEPDWSIEVAMFCLRETFSVLGFALDPDKSQVPAQVCAVLGVLFNTEALHTERLFHVSPKPSRIQNLKSTIHQVLANQELSPALAASIVGKFGFLCSTLFGKVGRCCTGALRHRQYSTHQTSHLSSELTTSLQLMLHFLDHSPSREVHLHHEPPVILYTDASDVPDRDPRCIVGAVLFDPLTNDLFYSAAEVTNDILSQWLPKSTYMGQLELLAAPFALATWERHLSHRSVLLFIDNDSAASNLVKGYSPKIDSSAIVGEFWLLASRLRLQVYIDRVESKSNLSDGPSRFEFNILQQLGGWWTPPTLTGLTHPTTDPKRWFGAPPQRGENI